MPDGSKEGAEKKKRNAAARHGASRSWRRAFLAPLFQNSAAVTTALTAFGYIVGYAALSVAASRLRTSVSDFSLNLPDYLLISLTIVGLLALSLLAAAVADIRGNPENSGFRSTIAMRRFRVRVLIFTASLTVVIALGVSYLWAENVRDFVVRGNNRFSSFLSLMGPNEVLKPQLGKASWSGVNKECVIRIGDHVLLARHGTLVVSEITRFQPERCKVLDHF